MSQSAFVVLKLKDGERTLSAEEAVALLDRKEISPLTLYHFVNDTKLDIVLHLGELFNGSPLASQPSNISDITEPHTASEIKSASAARSGAISLSSTEILKEGELPSQLLTFSCPRCHLIFGLAVFPLIDSEASTIKEACSAEAQKYASDHLAIQAEHERPALQSDDNLKPSPIVGEDTEPHEPERNADDLVDYEIDGHLDLRTFAREDLKEIISAYIQTCSIKGIPEVRIIFDGDIDDLSNIESNILSMIPAVESFESSGIGFGAVMTLVRLRP